MKKIVFWILAVVISLAIMVYQRLTGPTYEKDYTISYQGTSYDFELPRSHGGKSDAGVKLELPEPIRGHIVWRRYPTAERWDTVDLARTGDTLRAALPWQPPAGKLEYHLELFTGDRRIDLDETENVVIRFKGDVPAWAQVPHILLMVLTVIWSTAVIFFALANLPVYRKYLGTTMILLIMGGFIFGPIVQNFAFGQYWTGWPFGEDLTDNKVLLALVVFLVAWLLRKKRYGRWLAIAASLVLLAVYLIPHSARGSELDYGTGEVVTGAVGMLPIFWYF